MTQNPTYTPRRRERNQFKVDKLDVFQFSRHGMPRHTTKLGMPSWHSNEG
jgi:hypothetical protein